MTAYGGLEVWLHPFLQSALNGCYWLTTRRGRFILL